MLTASIHIFYQLGRYRSSRDYQDSADDLTDFLSGEHYVSITSIKSVIQHIHLLEKDDDVKDTMGKSIGLVN